MQTKLLLAALAATSVSAADSKAKAHSKAHAHAEAKAQTQQQIDTALEQRLLDYYTNCGAQFSNLAFNSEWDDQNQEYHLQAQFQVSGGEDSGCTDPDYDITYSLTQTAGATNVLIPSTVITDQSARDGSVYTVDLGYYADISGTISVEFVMMPQGVDCALPLDVWSIDTPNPVFCQATFSNLTGNLTANGQCADEETQYSNNYTFDIENWDNFACSQVTAGFVATDNYNVNNLLMAEMPIGNNQLATIAAANDGMIGVALSNVTYNSVDWAICFTNIDAPCLTAQMPPVFSCNVTAALDMQCPMAASQKGFDVQLIPQVNASCGCAPIQWMAAEYDSSFSSSNSSSSSSGSGSSSSSSDSENTGPVPNQVWSNSCADCEKMAAYVNFEPSQMNYVDFPTIYYGALDVFTQETPNSPSVNYGYIMSSCIPTPPACSPTVIDVNLSNQREIDYSQTFTIDFSATNVSCPLLSWSMDIMRSDDNQHITSLSGDNWDGTQKTLNQNMPFDELNRVTELFGKFYATITVSATAYGVQVGDQMSSGSILIVPEDCVLAANMSVTVTSDSTDSDYFVLITSGGNATEHWCYIPSINVNISEQYVDNDVVSNIIPNFNNLQFFSTGYVENVTANGDDAWCVNGSVTLSYNDPYYTAWGQSKTQNAQDFESGCRAPRCELTGITASMANWNVMTHDVCSQASMMSNFTVDMTIQGEDLCGPNAFFVDYELWFLPSGATPAGWTMVSSSTLESITSPTNLVIDEQSGTWKVVVNAGKNNPEPWELAVTANTNTTVHQPVCDFLVNSVSVGIAPSVAANSYIHTFVADTCTNQWCDTMCSSYTMTTPVWPLPSAQSYTQQGDMNAASITQLSGFVNGDYTYTLNYGQCTDPSGSTTVPFDYELSQVENWCTMTCSFDPSNTSTGMETQNSGVFNMATETVDQVTFSPSLAMYNDRICEFSSYNFSFTGASSDSSDESPESWYGANDLTENWQVKAITQNYVAAANLYSDPANGSTAFCSANYEYCQVCQLTNVGWTPLMFTESSSSSSMSDGSSSSSDSDIPSQMVPFESTSAGYNIYISYDFTAQGDCGDVVVSFDWTDYPWDVTSGGFETLPQVPEGIVTVNPASEQYLAGSTLPNGQISEFDQYIHQFTLVGPNTLVLGHKVQISQTVDTTPCRNGLSGELSGTATYTDIVNINAHVDCQVDVEISPIGWTALDSNAINTNWNVSCQQKGLQCTSLTGWAQIVQPNGVALDYTMSAEEITECLDSSVKISIPTTTTTPLSGQYCPYAQDTDSWTGHVADNYGECMNVDIPCYASVTDFHMLSATTNFDETMVALNLSMSLTAEQQRYCQGEQASFTIVNVNGPKGNVEFYYSLSASDLIAAKSANGFEMTAIVTNTKDVSYQGTLAYNTANGNAVPKVSSLYSFEVNEVCNMEVETFCLDELLQNPDGTVTATFGTLLHVSEKCRGDIEVHINMIHNGQYIDKFYKLTPDELYRFEDCETKKTIQMNIGTVDLVGEFYGQIELNSSGQYIVADSGVLSTL